jgi:hypothetical protein
MSGSKTETLNRKNIKTLISVTEGLATHMSEVSRHQQMSPHPQINNLFTYR